MVEDQPATVRKNPKLNAHHNGLGRYHFFFAGLSPLRPSNGSLSPPTDCPSCDRSEGLVGSARDVIPVASAVVYGGLSPGRRCCDDLERATSNVLVAGRELSYKLSGWNHLRRRRTCGKYKSQRERGRHELAATGPDKDKIDIIDVTQSQLISG